MPKSPSAAASTPATLTGNEVKILSALAKSATPLTRNALKEKTGINKGWSRILGANTKGEPAADTLLGRKLIRVAPKDEAVRGMAYEITAPGRKALEKSAK